MSVGVFFAKGKKSTVNLIRLRLILSIEAAIIYLSIVISLFTL